MIQAPAPFDRKNLLRQLGLLAVLGLLYAGGMYLRRERSPGPADDTSVLAALAAQPLSMTDHARCLLHCREISLEEVRSAIKNGRIAAGQSDAEDCPCPTWTVVDDTDSTRPALRVVLGACETETRLIRASREGQTEEHPACDCTGAG